MQISSVNDVKIYNLSHGKSLPEWLSDRKKRDLQKKDVDVQRRIELIQDFEMPTVCTSIKVSRDGQYIIAAGTYKPRVRCYDTYQLSLKFERCLDSDGSQSGPYRPTCLPRGTATTLLLCPLVMDLLCS